ncbi:insulinase family protein, partial [Patescibacteria group bacterium]|nr:insulinase family protein [Patescibacteria group bacterium]
TKKYPTTEDVNFIERMGGLQNAYTDVDITNYHNKLMASDWKEALELNKEFALYPRLEEQYVEKERDVILEEMKRYEDDLPVRVSEEFQKLMYPKTSLGMRVIGEEQSLRSSDANTLREYHDSMYTPERIVVVLAGNIKYQKSNIKNTHSASSGQANKILNIKRQAEEWFSNGSQRKCLKEAYKKVIDRQEKPEFSIVTKKDAQQAHLTLGIRTFARGSEDRFSWSVFNLLFGVSFTSRLFKEIREKRGLCYAIRSGSDNWDDVGYWSIYAGVATEKVGEAVSAIINELKKAADKGVSEKEVAVAKKRLLTMISFKTEDPEFMAEYYGQQELRRLPILSISDYFKKIEKVTKEDIHALIRKYIVANHLNLAVVWKRGQDEKLIKVLKL